MNNAVFVSVTEIYAELDASARLDRNSRSLRNCTCGWWRLNVGNATGVRYLFGVAHGAVVSAYAVGVPAADWPVMPAGGFVAGRKYVPVARPLSPAEWSAAAQWGPIPMYGPIRYGRVQDPGGIVASVEFDAEPGSPEEQPGDD